MKKETARVIHTLCGILLGDGCWDREIQMLVAEPLLKEACHDEEEAERALVLIQDVSAHSDAQEKAEGAETAALTAMQDEIQANARKLAEDMAFDFEDGVDPAALLPFPESDYCPDCSYHQDDHDMRAMNARGGVGACPVPDRCPICNLPGDADDYAKCARKLASSRPLGPLEEFYEVETDTWAVRYSGSREVVARSIEKREDARLYARAPRLLALARVVAAEPCGCPKMECHHTEASKILGSLEL